MNLIADDRAAEAETTWGNDLGFDPIQSLVWLKGSIDIEQAQGGNVRGCWIHSLAGR